MACYWYIQPQGVGVFLGCLLVYKHDALPTMRRGGAIMLYYILVVSPTVLFPTLLAGVV